MSVFSIGSGTSAYRILAVSSCSTPLQPFCENCFMFTVSCRPLAGSSRAALHTTHELYGSDSSVVSHQQQPSILTQKAGATHAVGGLSFYGSRHGGVQTHLQNESLAYYIVGSHYVAPADLRLGIFVPQPPQ